MSPQLAYLIIACIHIPIAYILMVRIFSRTFISGSVILHGAFLSHWLLSGIRFCYYGLGYDGPESVFAQNLIVMQCVLTLPLIGYAIPKLRKTLVLPCIAAYQENETILRAQKEQLLELLHKKDVQYTATIAAVRRYIRPKVRAVMNLAKTIHASDENKQVLSEVHMHLQQLTNIYNRLLTEEGIESIRRAAKEGD